MNKMLCTTQHFSAKNSAKLVLHAFLMLINKKKIGKANKYLEASESVLKSGFRSECVFDVVGIIFGRVKLSAI